MISLPNIGWLILYRLNQFMVGLEKLETAYWGSRASERQIRMYNKN
ncbi:hypothetical protein HI828_014270 (plasmid) [Enterococcus faecium]|nr:hypothetical protein HI828_014270 [Enterococcus faecium]